VHSQVFLHIKNSPSAGLPRGWLIFIDPIECQFIISNMYFTWVLLEIPQCLSSFLSCNLSIVYKQPLRCFSQVYIIPWANDCFLKPHKTWMFDRVILSHNYNQPLNWAWHSHNIIFPLPDMNFDRVDCVCNFVSREITRVGLHNVGNIMQHSDISASKICNHMLALDIHGNFLRGKLPIPTFSVPTIIASFSGLCKPRWSGIGWRNHISHRWKIVT